MKQLSTIILLLIVSISCKEKGVHKSTNDTHESAGPKVTNTVTKTDRHVKIPNSSLYIIPPAGFAVEETSATLTETDGTAYYMQMQILSGETKQSLFAKFKSEADKNFPGSWKEEAITVNGHTATIYHSKNTAFNQYYLAFTDGYTDEMIIANYEEKNSATGKSMYEAMKTVVVEK